MARGVPARQQEILQKLVTLPFSPSFPERAERFCDCQQQAPYTVHLLPRKSFSLHQNTKTKLSPLSFKVANCDLKERAAFIISTLCLPRAQSRGAYVPYACLPTVALRVGWVPFFITNTSQNNGRLTGFSEVLATLKKV